MAEAGSYIPRGGKGATLAERKRLARYGQDAQRERFSASCRLDLHHCCKRHDCACGCHADPVEMKGEH